MLNNNIWSEFYITLTWETVIWSVIFILVLHWVLRVFTVREFRLRPPEVLHQWRSLSLQRPLPGLTGLPSACSGSQTGRGRGAARGGEVDGSVERGAGSSQQWFIRGACALGARFGDEGQRSVLQRAGMVVLSGKWREERTSERKFQAALWFLCTSQRWRKGLR